jgi:hypothetical protein
MTTRTVCDHCGNTITNANSSNRFSYGPGVFSDDDETEPVQRTKPRPKRKNLDLCPICIPIWMKRVEDLTKASDPV